MLIPEYSYTEFRKLTAAQISRLKSCAVTSNGKAVFFAIVPSDAGGMAIKDDITTKAEYLGARMNSVCGKELDEVKHATLRV